MIRKGCPQNKLKLLLHVCCACCSTAVIEQLKNDYNITLFFSDSNIYPEEEYNKRLENAKKVAELLNVNLLEDEYDNNAWDNFVSKAESYQTLPEGDERCYYCFEYNLTRTAEFANVNNFDIFTTTLSISPHKNHIIINNIGKILEEKHEIKFLESNFKKQDGFRTSIELSKKYNIYRQNYCGCKYSMRR